MIDTVQQITNEFLNSLNAALVNIEIEKKNGSKQFKLDKIEEIKSVIIDEGDLDQELIDFNQALSNYEKQYDILKRNKIQSLLKAYNDRLTAVLLGDGTAAVANVSARPVAPAPSPTVTPVEQVQAQAPVQERPRERVQQQVVAPQVSNREETTGDERNVSGSTPSQTQLQPQVVENVSNTSTQEPVIETKELDDWISEIKKLI